MRTKNTMKMVTALLVLALTFGSMLPFCFAEGEVGTTEENPYVVTTAAQLTELGSLDEIGYVKLGADIDMSGEAATECVIKKLTGELDGGGYTVSNLTLKGAAGKNAFNLAYTGFIGELSGTVRNLALSNVQISAEAPIGSNNAVGFIAAKITNESVIDTCIVTNTSGITIPKTNSNSFVGGLAGEMGSDVSLTVRNSTGHVTVTGDGSSSTYFGGILGRANYTQSLTVEKSAVTGDARLTYGKCCGMIGSANGSLTLTLTDTCLQATIGGMTHYAIAYNMSTYSPINPVCSGFYYDATKNPAMSSYEDPLLRKGTPSGTVYSMTTAEFAAESFTIAGFERRADINGYLVPIWPAKEETPAQNSIAFDGDSAAVTVRESGRYTVVFAAYQGSKLQSCAMLADDFTAGTAKTVSAPESFNASGATTVKAMLWRSTADLCPLAGNAQK